MLIHLQTEAAPHKHTVLFSTVQKQFSQNDLLQLLGIICTYGNSSESHMASFVGPSGLVAAKGLKEKRKKPHKKHKKVEPKSDTNNNTAVLVSNRDDQNDGACLNRNFQNKSQVFHSWMSQLCPACAPKPTGSLHQRAKYPPVLRGCGAPPQKKSMQHHKKSKEK